MTDTKILTANNELLAAICAELGIETEFINQLDASIGGGGISQPTKD